jgi:drug/metabolite transporter (DMT)-like permease
MGEATTLARALLFITPLLWSVNYLVARWAPGEIAPHLLALCRWALASLVLLIFSWRELRGKWPQWRGEWWQFLGFGALGMWICGAWVYIGALSTSALNIALIYATSPVLIALLSWLWLKERMHWQQGAGIALALCGVLHVVLQGNWANILRLQFNLGDLWIAACALSWALYSLLLKRWHSVLSPVARLTCIAWGGCLVLLVPTAIEAAVWLPSHLSLKSIGLVVAAGLIPGAGAYFAYAYMQRVLGPARVAAVLYLGPVYAAVLAYLLLGEAIAWHHAMGALLILPGIYLASWKPKETA